MHGFLARPAPLPDTGRWQTLQSFLSWNLPSAIQHPMLLATCSKHVAIAIKFCAHNGAKTRQRSNARVRVNQPEERSGKASSDELLKEALGGQANRHRPGGTRALHYAPAIVPGNALLRRLPEGTHGDATFISTTSQIERTAVHLQPTPGYATKNISDSVSSVYRP